ncbi:3-hydroxyacyl-CoA dehydrogenase type-2-like isoform X1 [Galleria mellonella]|uniref:3-hydroxyacyl-CoA dehydrogenase type-2 n=2 Tax=Galleria mellonella TaxID=7137 RepID=A0A6J3CDW6_GALME|nr:3-hydroxyacyl-CoA dehydrogenase type-2-like isoform X1 [Galleria mellonella]XP_052756219.1 3-hydroxyacyl-CoA dehydrogenase type-2-like isoform X1 [Galleria mellonella]
MLKGMVSLVTGGASGLGKATVDRLVKNGGKVVILDIQATRAQEVAKRLGDNVIVSAGCITKEDDVRKALDIVREKFGRLDTLVNCAGHTETHQVYNFHKDKECSLEGFIKCVNVNTVGTFNVIRLAAGLIGKNKPNDDGQRGVIINTAATIAYEGDIGQAPYAASSAAIIGMTLPIARDLASQGIRVMTIAPGIFETPLISYIPEKMTDFLKRMSPFPTRFGKPEEFAHLVTSIVENPMLNGEVIRLDGAQRWFPL